MRAVIQRVKKASVAIDEKINGEISSGLLVFLGVLEGDLERHADFLAKKLVELRIFTDENDKMNLSVMDIKGEILVISQFTLGADCSHGRRPSFIKAMKPPVANELYEYFVRRVGELLGKQVQTGIFGADMSVSLINDGPVTIIFDTDEMGFKPNS